jgi:hypothetical protein
MLSSAAIGNVNGEHSRVPVIIPADTAIRVRTVDPIDANSAQLGAGFRRSLVDPLKSSSGAMVIPRGASGQLIVANVKESNRINGREKIDLKVTAIIVQRQKLSSGHNNSRIVGWRQG